MNSHTQRVAVFAALHTHYLTQNGTLNPQVVPEQDYALITYAPIIVVVLVLLMGGILVGVCILMRQKKKRIQEATSLSNLPWIETLEIFTVSGRDGAAGIYLPPGTPSPPPAYEAVVQNAKDDDAKAKKEAAASTNILRIEHETEEAKDPKQEEERDGLPTYEAAVKMENKYLVKDEEE